jgi:hypothetical protein
MAPPPVAPVEKAHKRGKKAMASKFKDYEEKPMLALNSGLGEGRCSEWTGKGGGLLGGPMHGYRATFLNTERRITVRCECPEQDWPTLKPAFEKVVASLGAHRG